VVPLAGEAAKEKGAFRGVVDRHGARLGDGPDGERRAVDLIEESRDEPPLVERSGRP
jgi:hypothetical protein